MRCALSLALLLSPFLAAGASLSGRDDLVNAGQDELNELNGRQQALEDAWDQELADPDTKIVAYKSPVQRVVALLTQMRDQLVQEADKEAEMYDKMVCWCDTNEKEKTKAIADADVKTDDLQADIESRSARHGTLATEITAMKEQIARDTEALKKATAIREKEAAAFMEEEKELVQAVTNLKNAVTVLSRHNAGALVQSDKIELPVLASVRAVLRDVSFKYQLMIAGAPVGLRGSRRPKAALLSMGEDSQAEALDTRLLKELDVRASSEVLPVNIAEHVLSQHAAEQQGAAVPREVSAFMQAVGSAPYSSYHASSGAIFGILKQMKDEFEASLTQAQADEMKARADYEELAKTKTAQIETGKEKLDAMEEEFADNQKALSDAKEDLDNTRKQRTADVEFLRNLKVTCANLDKDWQTRSAQRSEELKAVTETIAILTEDSAKEAASKALAFIQTVAEAEMQVRRSRAAATLRRALHAPELEADDLLAAWNTRRNGGAAAASNSVAAVGGPKAQLATLAISVELDSFSEVKKAMDSMIADLKEQQVDEVNSKAYCVKELDVTEKTTYTKTEHKKDLEAKIASLQTLIEKLSGEIEAHKVEIAETQVAIKKASQQREAENKEFQTVVADQRAVQEILKKALHRLEQFYSKGSLLQRGSATLKSGQTPPEQFTKYKKNAGSVSVMSLIDQIIQDSVKLEKDAQASEYQAQKDYEKFVLDSNNVISNLEESVTAKTKAVSTAKMDLEETNSEHKSTLDELESLAEYNADLHGECDFLLKNFDVRQAARLQEIEAIQKAKAILSGMAGASSA